MAKHAAPEVEETTSAPVAATTERRSKNYPILVEHAMSYYMLEVFDHVDRARRICKELEQVVQDQLGLDVAARILQLTPANNTNPETGEQETYDYVFLGLFFSNVTRSELESYCAKLLDYFEPRQNQVFTHPDIPLPTPHFTVPSADELRAMTAEVTAQRDRTKKFLNSEGQIDRNAVREAADEYRKEHGGTDPSTSSDSAWENTEEKKPAAPKGSLDAHEMF